MQLLFEINVEFILSHMVCNYKVFVYFQEIDVGCASGIRAMRLTHSGEDGFILYIPSEVIFYFSLLVLFKGHMSEKMTCSSVVEHPLMV